ncbi:MAG: hypothetical protein LUD50_02405 [Clostridia bacterium]|nr:hypothetical protein [Clostridia bacterium]
MQYKLNQDNYCTFETFGVNKLAGRSYFVPYPDKAGADKAAPKEKRYSSSKVKCLNGMWDFKFYPIPADVPETLDTDKVEWDRLDVPSCWQYRGYYHPVYVNQRYQFPFKPPQIPTTNPAGRAFFNCGNDVGIGLFWRKPKDEYNFVGVYRTTVSVAEPEKRHIISFMGVASCMDLYINGEFIGYSEGAHNIAEFDLSGKLSAGDNEMVVVVHRWCNGTYLEDQDMLRNNGIFRDVLLTTVEDTDFWDLDAQTKKAEDGTYSLTLTASTFADTDVTFTFTGHGLDRKATVKTEDKKATVTWDGLAVEEWNAEEPNLYDVFFETATSAVKEKIGFKDIKIKGTLFYVNGRLIKFHGVNHHDTSAVNGYCMTPDEVVRDVELCKEYNIDMIRTSHYPPDPLLLEMADELGVYIVDENDLETHGTVPATLPPTYNTISNNPKWESHYIDRISRLYERDKMHPSIVMWSLGNESGGYKNTDAMADWLHAHTDIPVHYESAVHCKRIAYDVGSEMYPSVKMVHDVGEKCRKQKPLNDRPYYLCEYAHAMGVGPGNIEAYWNEIYKYDNLMGGCIWEMVDHGVLQPNGSYKYGGDWGEWAHDGNFCADGIFYPDRRPSTGAFIAKFTYRPIRVKWVEGDTFEFFNTTGFTNGKNFKMSFVWNDGTTAEICPDVEPLKKIQLQVPVGKAVGDEQTCIVTATNLKTGKEVSKEQIIIMLNAPAAMADGDVPESFSAKDGKITLALGGADLTTAETSTLCYRARTDNDTHMAFFDAMKKYSAQTEEVVSTEKITNGYKIVSKVKNKKNCFEVTDTYEGCKGGILVTSKIHTYSGGGIIPRFGKSFYLPESFDDVTYTGRLGETYNDMREQFVIGTETRKVWDMTERNIRPQESGNRMDCTSASVTDGSVTVTFTAVDKPFELAVKPYTDAALIGMKHLDEEVRTGTYVTIQAFQQGIGTGSCGPEVAPEFKYPAKNDYEFKFLITVSRNK